MLSFLKHLENKSLVRALLQGSFPAALKAAFRAAEGASLKKRELSCVHTSSYLSY